MRDYFIEICYLAASVLFILGLRGLSHPESARRGMQLAEFGMLMAIIGTLMKREIIGFEWIIAGLFLGSTIGLAIGLWVPMTAMPQRTAFSHACGALAASLVGVAEYSLHGAHLTGFKMGAISFEVLLGSLTTTGSLIAFAKLEGMIRGAPITYKGQNVFNLSLLAVTVGCFIALLLHPGLSVLFYLMLALAFVFGILLVLPIGAADMPVVIALLNSYAGLAAAATGFAIGNNVLIIAGTLDGGSGFILSILMCKAMNRSITNVLFGAFGSVVEGGPATAGGEMRELNLEDVAVQMAYARQVVIVPGYGMATAQAQHALRELSSALEERGVSVKFAIHPVAGRMPGHMNVLLAEANVPYDEVFELEDINGEFAQADVAFIIGANDVVNPAAKTDKSSPIYGMPVFDVDKAKTVMFIKRSMGGVGYSGVDNDVFYMDQTMMLLADAKKMVEDIVKALAH